MKDHMPETLHGRVVNARLTSGLIEFSATDWLHPTRVPKPGNTVGLYLNAGTYAELQKAFTNLSVGADPLLIDELQDMPFGTYGHLADRYGVHWYLQGQRRGAN